MELLRKGFFYASFFLCKELLPGYLSDITGEYATPEGYLVDEKETEEFEKRRKNYRDNYFNSVKVM